MVPVALRAAASYLPYSTVPVTDLPELTELSQAELATCLGLGIERVPVDADLTAADLAERAARQAIAEAGLGPNDIDALIMVESRAPGMLIASEATRLQSRLGAYRAVTFSVGGLGCVSVTSALLAARGLLATEPDMSNILLAHGSKPATHRRYRHPVTVNGDGGQAAVVARDGPVRIRDILVETNGEYWDLFRVDYRDRPSARWHEECTDLVKYSFQLAVETRNRLRALNHRALGRNGLQQGDVSCYLSQNLSVGAFRLYEELLETRIAGACYDNLRQYGHLGANDVLLNLYRAIDHGQLPDGGRAVVLNAAPAAAWSALLVETGEPTAADGRTYYL
jgi:3-oxoacyl-[acyl-carrier-protein] synthase-3